MRPTTISLTAVLLITSSLLCGQISTSYAAPTFTGIDTYSNTIYSASGVVTGQFGTNPNDSFHWKLGVLSTIPRPPGATSTAPTATSEDGTTIVGHSVYRISLSLARSEAFYYTEEDGLVSLGDFPSPVINSIATAVSADGSIIVGGATPVRPDGEEGSTAFLWTPGTGLVDIRDSLQSSGINMTDWNLDTAYSVERFGNNEARIAGTGTHNGMQESWLAVVPLTTATVPEPTTAMLGVTVLVCCSLFLVFHHYDRSKKGRR